MGCSATPTRGLLRLRPLTPPPPGGQTAHEEFVLFALRERAAAKAASQQQPEAGGGGGGGSIRRLQFGGPRRPAFGRSVSSSIDEGAAASSPDGEGGGGFPVELAGAMRPLVATRTAWPATVLPAQPMTLAPPLAYLANAFDRFYRQVRLTDQPF